MRALVLALAIAVAPIGTAGADDRVRAETYFRAGEQAYRAQSFAAAAKNFEEAYRALPLAEIAFSAAQSYRRLYRIDGVADHVTRAIELYHAYLAKVQTGGRVADAADALGEMQRELDGLIKKGIQVKPEIAAEHTQLGVNVALAGAPARAGVHEVEDQAPGIAGEVHVTIDAAKADAFTLVNVPPGPHKIHVEAPGYFPRDKEAVAVQGTSAMIDVALDPKPGRIAITTDAGARIQVDGRSGGVGPLATIEVPAGHHLVTIERRGREPIAREVAIANDERVPLDAPLAITARRRAVPWVLGGAGLLVAATGVTATVALLAQHDALQIRDRAGTSGNLDSSEAAAYEQDRQRRDHFATATWITGGAALATAAIGLSLYYFDEPSPRLAPAVSRDGVGAAVVGTF